MAHYKRRHHTFGMLTFDVPFGHNMSLHLAAILHRSVESTLPIANLLNGRTGKYTCIKEQLALKKSFFNMGHSRYFLLLHYCSLFSTVDS